MLKKIIITYDPNCDKCNGELKIYEETKPGKKELTFCDCVTLYRNIQKGKRQEISQIKF